MEFQSSFSVSKSYQSTRRSSSCYIAGKFFDISLFMLGAFMPLIFLVLYFNAGVPMVPLMLTFVLLLDAPHAMQTLTRIFMDRQGRQQFGLRTLYCFLIMVLVSGLFILSGNSFYILVILLFYGSYHIMLQHFGIAALYRTRDRNGAIVSSARDKHLLLAVYCLCLAWASSDLFNMGPLWLWPQFIQLFDDLGIGFFPLQLNQFWTLVVLPAAGLYFLVAAGLWLHSFWQQRTRNQALNRPWLVVISLAVINYFLVFFGLNAIASSLNEGLFLTVIGITAWHAVQYHGLVWYYNNKKFGHATEPSHDSRLLAWLSQKQRYPFYIAFIALITVATQGLVLGLHWLDTHVIKAWLGSTRDLAYLGYSVTFTHYYLDALIWKFKHNKELSEVLGGSGQSASMSHL